MDKTAESSWSGTKAAINIFILGTSTTSVSRLTSEVARFTAYGAFSMPGIAANTQLFLR